MVCITDPSGGPGARNKLLPGAHGYDVERDVIAVLRSERIAHSNHHLRQVTAAVRVHVRRFLHQSDSPRAVRVLKVKAKVAHTRLPNVGFRSLSRFLAVSLQVM